MAKAGRGHTIPPRTQVQIVELYCQRESETAFLYNVPEIASLVDLDPKTTNRLLREICAVLLERWLLEEKDTWLRLQKSEHNCWG